MSTTVINIHRALTIFGLFGMLLSGCTGRGNVSIEIGPHRGTVGSPSGWSVVDQGEKWELRKAEASIVC